MDAAPPSQPYVEPAAPRSRRGVAALVVGALTVAGGGAFAATQLGASDGAGSPEAAVDALMTALAEEDLIGVMEALAPGERDALRQPLEDVVDELERIGVLQEGTGLSGWDGVDVGLDDLTYATEPVTEDLAVVEVTGGRSSLRFDPAALPLGDWLREQLDAEGAALAVEEQTADIEPGTRLATVRRGGDWYVSLGFTVGEEARRASGQPYPAVPVAPAGADSPEGAVEAFADAALGLDLERVVALTPPGEADALHAYAPLFLDDARAALDEVVDEAGYRGELLELTATAEGSGSTRRVVVDTWLAAVELDGERTEVRWDGECLEVDGDRICGTDVLGTGQPAPVGAEATFGMSVVEVDGAWYVSPTRSLLDGVVGVLRLVPEDGLQQMAEAFGGGGGLLTPAD